MHLVIHDASLRKVAFVDNTKQNTLKYIKYEWYRSLETAGSTFNVTIQKRAIQTDNHYEVAYNHLNEQSFITFKAKNKTHLFSVMVVTENEETITCECESANLELINEYANAYKASNAMSFVEYCNAMGLLSFTYLTIRLNEVSDKKLTLEWEGQDTKLARLLSLANKFDAEIEFDTRLNADSSIKQFILNVYRENDDKHQGVGRIREDVQLVYGKNIKSVTRTIDKTNVVNAIRPTGTKDGKTVVISGLGAWEEKNEDGVVEFYQKGEMLYAPISMQLYPSTFTHGTINDQWTRKDIAVDSDNPTVVRAEGIKALKRLAYPSITYEVDGFFDGEIGDTVKVIDNGFVPKLILKARVIEQYIYDDETKNKTVLGNFTALENRLSDDIQERLNELVEQAKPYTIKLSTDNGVVFKNNIGQSIVTPTLYKGGKPVVTNVTWRWALGGNVTTGMTYTVLGSNVTDTATLTVSAYVGNDEVVTDEVSFVNVVDGADGIPGKDGVGIKTTTITYGQSASGTVQPTAWTSTVPSVPSGQYLWTKTIWTCTDNTTEAGYSVAKMGADGSQGPKGDSTGIAISNTEPSTKYVNMLWKHTGNVNGLITGATYRWTGSKWELYLFTAANISADTISAITADLGKISGGSLGLLKSEAQATSVDAWGNFTIPAHKWGLYIDNIGAISSGTPVRKSSSESTASDMPVAVLTSGQLRFARVDQNNDLESVLHYGLSDPDNATISFDVAPDGTKRLLIQANGQIVNRGTNYTGWNSTGVSGVFYKRQGDVVALKMQVTTTANQSLNLGKIPVSLVPLQNAGTMIRVAIWNVDQTVGRNLQINGDGTMLLLSSSHAGAINTQVTWII